MKRSPKNGNPFECSATFSSAKYKETVEYDESDADGSRNSEYKR